VLTAAALPLAQACWEIGSPQLRNRATIAGNVVTASPANDTISALWALDATVELTSTRGVRLVKLRELYTGVRRTVIEPDELLTDISFAALPETARGIFVKLGLRRAQAISVVHAAIILRTDGDLVTGAEIALGSVAPTIVSAPRAAAELIGRNLSDESISAAAEAAAAEVSPIDDLRATAAYRDNGVRICIERGLNALRAGRARAEWPTTPVLLGPAEGILGRGHGLDALVAGESVGMRVNGVTVSGAARPDMTLLDWLRDQGLTGTKEGCAEGECGACTVWLDDAAVMSCLVAAPAAAGATVVTIEGLADSPEDLHPLQQAFIDHGAVQCGFCIPGILMAAGRLVADGAAHSGGAISRDDVGRALSGNLCRCTGYYKIIDAVMAAAGGAP
jgi:carbon-monoxide dehydrogenase medium subunit